jgi:SAM-dependent methyltransferase
MDGLATGYPAGFYAGQRGGSLRSAQAILPIVFEAVRPQSVVDVGCGVGTWLYPARALGARRTVGIEGDWVAPPPEATGIELHHARLEEPIALDERFDLALCLEVAEHLAPMRARGLVADLTRLGRHVLFSAAIPGQGGHLHINEQWQGYWAALFAEHGYGARDLVRPAVRWRPGVEFWYRQNTILYSPDTPLVEPGSLDAVHPYQHVAWVINATLDVLRPAGTPRPRRPRSRLSA